MPWLRSAAFEAHLSHFVAAGCFILSAISLPTVAADYPIQHLLVEHPYARPTPPGARTGGAYFTVRNEGSEADRLLRVSSPAAKSAEIHSMTMDGNVMRMRNVPSLDIPADATVTLSPGGYHVMLVGLAHPLVAGQQVRLTLTFEKAGAIDVHADVEAAPPHGQAHAH
ncbi:MAG TPA: copper chaperone PCu(A)C [Casimicrobiaceae bacterium]